MATLPVDNRGKKYNPYLLTTAFVTYMLHMQRVILRISPLSEISGSATAF